MSTINKALVIAVIATAIVGIPVYLIDLHLTPVQLLIALFLVSLASAISAAQPARARQPAPHNASRKAAAPARSASRNSPRESGSVKWFNASKGFGFITRDSGDDIFVHFRSIRGEGHRVLHDGQRVEFAISEGDKGLQAEDVAAAK